jgi:hypothetical protein
MLAETVRDSSNMEKPCISFTYDLTDAPAGRMPVTGLGRIGKRKVGY